MSGTPAGGFDSAVADYESLMAMARSQGAIGSGPRGACKTCGQLGHLTKQCRNHLSTYFAGQPAVKPSLPVLPEGAFCCKKSCIVLIQLCLVLFGQNLSWLVWVHCNCMAWAWVWLCV